MSPPPFEKPIGLAVFNDVVAPFLPSPLLPKDLPYSRPPQRGENKRRLVPQAFPCREAATRAVFLSCNLIFWTVPEERGDSPKAGGSSLNPFPLSSSPLHPTLQTTLQSQNLPKDKLCTRTEFILDQVNPSNRQRNKASYF